MKKSAIRTIVAAAFIAVAGATVAGASERAVPPHAIAGDSVYHLYCPKCGHTWFSSHWDNYCPRWGCTGQARRM